MLRRHLSLELLKLLCILLHKLRLALSLCLCGHDLERLHALDNGREVGRGCSLGLGLSLSLSLGREVGGLLRQRRC